MAKVLGLGYVQIETSNLEAYKELLCDVLGLQIGAVDDKQQLLLRCDEKAYRVDLRRGEAEAITVLGWEVKGQDELSELAAALADNGYKTRYADSDKLVERRVSGLVEFNDPNGQRIELFYGLKKDAQPFVSPTGARFVTGEMGLGHVFQFVQDQPAYDVLYQSILGLRLSDHIEFRPGAHATFTHANSRHHSIAYAEVPDTPTRVSHLMFEVDQMQSVGRAWAKVEAGAAPVGASIGQHTNDEMFSFYARTPSGFQVEYGWGGKKIDDEVWTPSRYDVSSIWGHHRTDLTEPDV